MLVKGDHVYLRLVRDSDLDRLFEFDESIESLGPWFPIFITSEPSFRSAFAKDGFWSADKGTVLICAIEDGRLLGALYCFRSIFYLEGFEVAYRLFDLADSGRGIMREALALFTWLLFVAKKINRLELRIEAANVASRRVAERNGYRHEGTERGALYHRGEYHDLEVYVLLRADAPRTVEEALARCAGASDAPVSA